MYTQEDVQILLKLDAFKVGFTPQDNSEIYSDFEIVSVVTVNIFWPPTALFYVTNCTHVVKNYVQTSHIK